MKTLKLALISFAVGATLSTGSLAAYACASTIYVQDQSDCHFYSRYVLVGLASTGPAKRNATSLTVLRL